MNPFESGRIKVEAIQYRWLNKESRWTNLPEVTDFIGPAPEGKPSGSQWLHQTFYPEYGEDGFFLVGDALTPHYGIVPLETWIIRGAEGEIYLCRNQYHFESVFRRCGELCGVIERYHLRKTADSEDESED